MGTLTLLEVQKRLGLDLRQFATLIGCAEGELKRAQHTGDEALPDKCRKRLVTLGYGAALGIVG